MMTNQQVIDTYEAMQALTARMLVAAGNADWDELETLEQQVSRHTQRLKDNEEKVVLESAGRLRKVQLIKQMLEDDRKIRDLAMPWMAQLTKLINSTGTERRLANAYSVLEQGPAPCCPIISAWRRSPRSRAPGLPILSPNRARPNSSVPCRAWSANR